MYECGAVMLRHLWLWIIRVVSDWSLDHHSMRDRKGSFFPIFGKASSGTFSGGQPEMWIQVHLEDDDCSGNDEPLISDSSSGDPKSYSCTEKISSLH